MYIKLNLNGKELGGEYKQIKKEVDAVAYSVYGLYDKPSVKKVEAEEEIEKTMNACGGYGYRVTGGNTCTFSAVWFIKIDGEEFQIRETAYNRFIEGPKTITIQNAIEEEKAEKRRQKKQAKEYSRKRTEEAEAFKNYILSVYNDIKDIMGDNYKAIYKILENEAFEFCKDLEIIKPWYVEASEILNQFKPE